MKIALYYIITLLTFILVLSFKPNPVSWTNADLKEVAKELKEMQLSYSKINTYSVSVNYFTFDTKSEMNEIQDKSKGYYVKFGKNCKSHLLGIYSIQNEKYRITIDSSKKIIHVTNAFEFRDPGFSMNDYIKILSICKMVKQMKEKDVVGYRFETKNKEGIIAQEVFLENGITKEVNVFYANEHFTRENNSIKKEIVYPKLQVVFSGFNQKITPIAADFSTNKIFIIDRDKRIKLTSEYKGFKLIDGRVKK